MKLNLVVLRTTRIEELKQFYTELGVQFQIEKHGNGPFHYVAVLGTVVLELYPSSETGVRLGFAVSPKRILTDPDGRKVECS